MSSSLVGRLIPAAALAACLAVLAPTPLFAQHPLPEPPTSAEFMPSFDWYMSAAALIHPDPRFDWDTRWVGDFDLFSYPKGRVTFLADYQTILGNEFRPFDPYQSNYLLEASGSLFLGRTEVAGVLSHISRHLGDRPKRVAVAENSLGPRVMRRLGGDRTWLDVRVDVRKVIARAYDDYSWIEQLDLVARRRVSAKTELYGRGFGELIQVDASVAGRDMQKGGRVEAGVKVHGRAGAMEFFVGGEQIIDADPLDRLSRRWAFVGFRLLGR